MRYLFIFLLSFFISFTSKADVLGFWTTIDDKTGKEKSVVQIYEEKGKIFGKVVDIFGNKEATAKIEGAPKIMGLQIIWDLEKNKNKYTGGKILDPQSGKIYGCEIWEENGNLIVRGKIAFLGRNQTWKRNTIHQ
ncbi:MAG: DUF2147 domain-containing protein [Alphaproteobacteria bacterium]|nr:DUF2147 domain-containing protein [Alphaproteobacteria bacterium]